MNDLAVRIAQAPRVTEHGSWQRHVPAAYATTALEGRAADGRWGTKGGFSVLYLGRPTDSVVVEAYRHLVDPLEFDDTGDRRRFLATIKPRALITCSVKVDNLLDLRTPATRASVGLVIQDLRSSTEDDEAYARCQEVAQVAHQLRFNGLVAPAATGLGETLVLFTDILPAAQIPVLVGAPVNWIELPDDPRAEPGRPSLRIVGDG